MEDQERPLARKRLGLYGALAAISGVLVVVLPFAGVTLAGTSLVGDGGVAMVVLLGLGVLGAAATAVLGVRAVRGKRRPLGVIALLPVVYPLVAVVCVRLAVKVVADASSGAALGPSQKMRVLALGTAGIDALYIFGGYLGAAAFGAASIVMLGAAACIDGPRGEDRAERMTTIAGIVGAVVAIATHVLSRSPGSLVVIVPFFVVVTMLARSAARKNAFVRARRDAREVRDWLALLYAAAIAAGACLILLDFATLALAERRALAAFAAFGSAQVDEAQQLQVLLGIADQRRASLASAALDGIFAFGTIAVPLFVPRRQPLLTSTSALALASAFLTALGLIVSRAQVTGLTEHTWAGLNSFPIEPPGAYAHAHEHRGDARVDLHGGAPAPESTRELSWYDRTLLIDADASTPWAHVLRRAAKEVHIRNMAMPERNADTSPPSLGILLTPRDPDERRLGWYKAFLVGEHPRLRLGFAYAGVNKTPDVMRDIAANATLDDVVKEYARRVEGRRTEDLPAIFVELPDDM